MTATNPHSIKGSIAGIAAIKGVSAAGTLDATELDGVTLVPSSSSLVVLTTGGVTGKESVDHAMTAIAGTVATSSIAASSGVLKVDIKNTDATTEAAAADTVLTAIAATGVNKSTTIQNLAKPLGAIIAGTNATSALSEIDGVARVNIGAVTGKAAPVGADMLLIEDTVAPDANVNKMCTVTQLAETLAGTVTDSGIENTAGVLAVVPASLTAATPVGADSLLFADVNATPANAARKVTLTNLMEVVAGTVSVSGIENTTGVLSIVPTSLAAATPVGADSLIFGDTDDSLAKKVTLTNLMEVVAGTVTDSGIENTDGVLAVVPASLTAATPVGADSLLFADVNATPANAARKVTLTNLMEVVAGTVTASGIENTTGVLSIAPASLTPNATPAVGDILILADIDAANAPKASTVTELMETVAGTVGTTGIENTAGVLSVAPADNAITVGADSLVYMTAAGVPKKDLISDVATALVGTTANSGLKATAGVLSGTITDLTAADVNVAADMFAFSDEETTGDPLRKESFADLATAMAGTGLVAASGVLATKTPGAVAVGSIRFAAQADCTSVTIGTIVYLYDATPDNAAGEWGPHGGTASASATALAAAINADARLGAAPCSFYATVNSDTVHVYAKTAGTAGNLTITRQDGAQPSVLEATVGGLAAATKQWCMRGHTVTASDVETAVLVNIPIPFVPTMFTASVLSSAGVPVTVTDAFTIGTVPNRIVVTHAGAGTHLVAGDVVTIMAHE